MSEPKVLYEWTDDRGDRHRLVERFDFPLYQYQALGEWHNGKSLTSSIIQSREILRLLSARDALREALSNLAATATDLRRERDEARALLASLVSGAVTDGDTCIAFYSEAVVTARKPWKCCECRRAIAVGEQYERASGMTDGCIFTEKTCLVCREIRKAFACDGWVFGDLWEAIYESLFDTWERSGPWDCLAKLETQQARQRMNDEYEKWKARR